VPGSVLTVRQAKPTQSRVAFDVREMIRSRGLRHGDRLPKYQDLARELGTSYVTVKRGMDQLASQGLVERVASKGTFVAKELALVPRELCHIGVICGSSRNSLFLFSYLGEIMRGVTQVGPNYADMHIFSMRQDGMVRAAQFAERQVDGVLLLNVENDDYLRAFAQWGTPGVVVDYCSEAAPLDYVACDNQPAARQIVDYLASQGHRRVVYATASSRQTVVQPEDLHATLLVRDSSDVRERQAACEAALRERDMLHDVWVLVWDPTGLAAAARKVVGKLREAVATAILTDCNHTAVKLQQAFAHAGLRVPQDVSLATVASDGDLPLDGPALTRCRFDFLDMGRRAVTLLAERCRAPGLTAPRVHRIRFRFLEGETVGRQRGARMRRGCRSG